MHWAGFGASSWYSMERICVATVSPDSCCHRVGMLTSSPPCFAVSKKLSNMQWYCGGTHPVCRFRTRYTFLAWKGLGPRLIPRCVHGDQCVIASPAARSFSNAKAGRPKAWMCFILWPTLMELKSSSLDILSSRTGKMLWRETAFLKSYGHRARWMAAGHCWNPQGWVHTKSTLTEGPTDPVR